MGIQVLFPFLYLLYSEYHVLHAPPHFWHTWRVFLKQDARGNQVQDLVPAFFPRSAFCQRFIMQTSVRQLWIIPFLLTKKFQTDIFLRDISLCYVNAVQLGKGIPKGFPYSRIKVDCCLSDDSFWTTSQVLFPLDCIPDGSLHFIPFYSADLPSYKILCSGFLNGHLPFGTLLEVSPKERHTFNRL